MSVSLARTMLDSPSSDVSWSCMLEHHSEFIWDEHGDHVHDWNTMIAADAGFPEVSTIVDDEGDIFYGYRERYIMVPFQDDRGDNLIGVYSLARLVESDSELRFCRDSWHSSDVAFLALAPGQWRALEEEYGREAIEGRFLRVDPDFNAFAAAAFTDPGAASVNAPLRTAAVASLKEVPKMALPGVRAFIDAALLCGDDNYPEVLKTYDFDGAEVSINFYVKTELECEEILANANFCKKLDTLALRARTDGIIVNAISISSLERLSTLDGGENRDHSLIST